MTTATIADRAVYATIWITLSLLNIIVALAVGYWHFQETLAEQALQSRSLLPTPFHYGPADALRDSDVLDNLKSFKDNLS